MTAEGPRLKIYGSRTTSLTILNAEIEDIMKIVKSLEQSRLLVQGISETIKHKSKEQKRISSNVIRSISC